MKLILTMLILALSYSAFAETVTWSSQELNRVYKLNKKFELQHDNGTVPFPKNTYFELVEKSKLEMIKVHLHKYTVSNCSSADIETDLELIQVEQPDNTTTAVGVNLTKKCKVEIFIDMKEYETTSFFN
jgi:hypothetical protein